MEFRGSFLDALGGVRRFSRLPPEDRTLVFYAEDEGYRTYLAPIIDRLTGPMDQRVVYLTSSAGDYAEMQEHGTANLLPFYIGDGHARTWLFRSLEASICVMTMPDLGTFHLKRSVYPVHYVYVFHSMVSSHMIYRKGAFDSYDTIFCVGPHHDREIRATEEIYGLPAKSLVPHGYERLDRILSRNFGDTLPAGPPYRVLLAPSWGPNGILETIGEAVVGELLNAGFHVTVRPHPMTVKTAKRCLDRLVSRFGESPAMTYEEDIASTVSLEQAHLMISDWSGAALDFAFGYERPVLFIDVPRKVNNPEWERIGIEPIEAGLRTRIGKIVSADDHSGMIAAARSLIERGSSSLADIRRLREETVYNIGESAAVAAAHIASLAERRP